MSLIEEFIDVGARAMLAAMIGDEKEHKRLIEKGKSIKKEMERLHIHQRELKNFFEDIDIKIDKKEKSAKVKFNPKITTNLSDVFKAAGVTKK